MSEEKKMWGIHTQNDYLFLHGNAIVVGWKEIGDLTSVSPDRESFREKYAAAYLDSKKGSISISSGMLFRFAHEMQIGDYVVFPSKTDRMVNIDVVDGIMNIVFCDSIVTLPDTWNYQISYNYAIMN